MLAESVLHRVLPIVCLASCAFGDRAPTYADLCRSEMAVLSVPPDTSASMRALERELADSVTARTARKSPPVNEHEIVGMAIALAYQRRVSDSDVLTALALADIRGLFDDRFMGAEKYFFSRLLQILGTQRDGPRQGGPERVWSLLAVPPAECAIQAYCPTLLIGLAPQFAAPWGREVGYSDSLRSPYYRGAFCRLVTLYADSAWPTRRQDPEALREERGLVVSLGVDLLEWLADAGRRSDAEFVTTALRAARASGDLGRELAQSYSSRRASRR